MTIQEALPAPYLNHVVGVVKCSMYKTQLYLETQSFYYVLKARPTVYVIGRNNVCSLAIHVLPLLIMSQPNRTTSLLAMADVYCKMFMDP